MIQKFRWREKHSVLECRDQKASLNEVALTLGSFLQDAIGEDESCEILLHMVSLQIYSKGLEGVQCQ